MGDSLNGFHFNAKVLDGYKYTDHPCYNTWAGMKQRCYYEKHNRYDRYGGRGIKVCDRWLDSFENFVRDMGPCPPGHSIERVDNDGDYCPENCVWADRKTQCSNRGTRSDSVLGEKYIQHLPDISRYKVQIRGYGKQFTRQVPSLEEAIEARNKFLKEMSNDS